MDTNNNHRRAASEVAPIKTDLFRFITTRTPQMISEEKKKWSFIFHPEPGKSHFLKELNNGNLSKARAEVNTRTKSFKPFASVSDLRIKFRKMLEFSTWLTKNRHNLTYENVSEQIKSANTISEGDLIFIWDNLFNQVIQCDNYPIRQVCIQLIIADNFVKTISTAGIEEVAKKLIQTPKLPLPPSEKERLPLFMKRLSQAKIVIPKVFTAEKLESDATLESDKNDNQKKPNTDKQKPNDRDSSDASTLYGVHNLGIAVLRKVEQEVCCYVPGEVSRIENIMAREYKERTTRSLISTEEITEDTTELEIENQSDTVSTTRNELQSEIANTLSNTNSITTGASLGTTVQGGFGVGTGSDGLIGTDVTVDASGYFDFASSNSSTTSDSAAQTFAQEVTESALERVLQKTTQKRTSRMLQEFEETNRHGFDNREGTEHVTGVYRWVDIVYTNRLINYGKRLMMEFLIPEPARFYLDVINNKKGKKKTKSQKPETPEFHGITSYLDITEENYLGLGQTFDVKLDDPIGPEETTINKSFGPKNDPDAKESDYAYTMFFNESGDYTKYSAIEAEINFNFDYHLKTGGTHTETGTYFNLKVYDSSFNYNKENLNDSEGTSESKSANKPATKIISLPNLTNELSPISVQMKNVYDFAINITVTMKLNAEVKEAWQYAVYDAILKGYEAQLAEYEKSKEDKSDEQEETTISSNTDFNRTIEQREIQRIAIEMLTKPFDLPMGKDAYYETKKCKIPQVEQTKAWEKYASRVKFFEQAFDWSLMGYIFYPYYWASKCDWRDLFQTAPSDDPIFSAFLQSGMSRAVIPVRKGFEDAVNYYLETGDIWNGGGLVIDSDDDLYLSIAEELQEVEGFVESEWPSRVPTTLTIIQGKSVYLDDESLPCCHRMEEGADTLLKSSTIVLGSNSNPE